MVRFRECLMARAELTESRWVTAVSSDGPITAEYRAVISSIRQCEPRLHRFDPALYPTDVVEAARQWWMLMMRTEYESSSVFVDLALQMRQIDAPLDVQVVVLRMGQDELHHAEICARVIEALGAEARIPAPPVKRLVTHPNCSLEESLLRNVIYCCCLGETVNAARLAKRLGEVRDPFIREIFRQLAADERLHAQFGFHYLETRLEWLDGRPEVRRSLAHYLRHAFAMLEQYMGANPPDARTPTEAESAIGLPDLTELSSTFQETMLNVCIPGLERFGIEAESSWCERTSEINPAPA